MATTRLFAPRPYDSIDFGVATVAPILSTGTDVDNTKVAAVQAAAVAGGYGTLATSAGGAAPAPFAAPLRDRGPWQANTVYSYGDVVTQAGSVYVAPSSFTSGSSFVAGNWTKLGLYDATDPSLATTYAAVFPVAAPSGDATGATDTAAIQAAIDLAAAAGGWVHLQPGTYIVGQSVQDTTVCVLSKTGVKVRGSGFNTIIKAANTLPGAVTAVVGNTSTGSYKLAYEAFQIDGNKANQGHQVHGLRLTGMGASYTTSPYAENAVGSGPMNVVNKVFAYNCSGSGFVSANQAGETDYTDCWSFGQALHGYDLEFDSRITNCVAASTGNHGFKSGGGNNAFHGCKAYMNGFGNGTQYGGFSLASRDRVAACHVQESDSNAFVIAGTGVIAEDCVVSGVSGSAFYFPSGAVNCKIAGSVHPEALPSGSRSVASCAYFETGSSGNQVHLVTSDANVNTAGGPAIVGNSVVVNNQDGAQALAYAATITPSPYDGGVVTVTLTGNITINNTVRKHAGSRMRLVLTQDGTGGRTVTWGAGIVGPAVTTTASTVTVVELVSPDGYLWVQTGASAAAVPAAGTTTRVADTGTRTYDVAALSVSQSGHPVIASNPFKIATNKIQCTAASPDASLVWETNASDVTVQATFPTVGSTNTGIILRRKTDTSQIIVISGQTYTVDAAHSVFTPIGAAYANFANGDTVKVVAAGTSITVYINGSSVMTTTSSFNQTATRHGLRTATTTSAITNYSAAA